MSSDFKETIIKLMQHSVVFEKPIRELSDDEIEYAYGLLYDLSMQSHDDNVTQVDAIQQARLCFNLAELCDSRCEIERAKRFYKSAFFYLTKGGIDLSIKKWVELVSLRTNESEMCKPFA